MNEARAALDRAFYALVPDKILDAVEAATGRRATGYALSLHSYENRVYEVELEESDRVVAKFYRPGRWSEAAIREEHEFLRELVENEVPAVAPLVLDGETVRRVEVDGAPIYCALFAKVRGRPTEEPDDEKLAILGRLLARLHTVGRAQGAAHRGRLDVASYGRESLRRLVSDGHLPQAIARRYEDAVTRLLDRIDPMFDELAPASAQQRIHADCHHGNLLWDASGPFFLDFDDFTLGPPVQDLWLVVPGRDEEAQARRRVLIEAYEDLADFDRRSLALIEPLRALCIVRYAGWIAARYDDPAFQRAFPDFRDEAFWQRELGTVLELDEIIAAGRSAR
jgi:Ser/Thr protein kinase RdoA (MazF antagonist)